MHLTYVEPASCAFTSWASWGLTIGSGCSLVAARWQAFLFIPEFPQHSPAHHPWWLMTVTSLFTEKAGNIPFLKFQKKLLSSTTEGKWIFKNTYTYCVYIWILYMDTVYQYINMTLTLCIYIYMECNSFTNTSLCRPGSLNLVWEEGMSRRITRLYEKKMHTLTHTIPHRAKWRSFCEQ